MIAWVSQTYGVFGWLDVPTPGLAVLTWLAFGCAAFVLVVMGSRHRLRVVVTIGAGVALTVVIPLAFQLTVGRQVGIHFWQARYTMPFGQGIPLALGVLGAGWRGQPAELTSLLRVARPVAWLLWPVLGTVAFVWAIHRYVKGDDGDWSLSTPPWTPPGGMALLVGTYVVAGAASRGRCGMVCRPRGQGRRDRAQFRVPRHWTDSRDPSARRLSPRTLTPRVGCGPIVGKGPRGAGARRGRCEACPRAVRAGPPRLPGAPPRLGLRDADHVRTRRTGRLPRVEPLERGSSRPIARPKASGRSRSRNR